MIDSGLRAKVYKVVDGHGKWAVTGMRFSSKKGKAWNGRGPLSLAFRNWAEHQFKYPWRKGLDYKEFKKAERKFLEEHVINHAEENGWHIYELSDAGGRWLTVREFYNERQQNNR